MLKRWTLNRVDTISAGKLWGVINGVLGILVGAIFDVMADVGIRLSRQGKSVLLTRLLGASICGRSAH